MTASNTRHAVVRLSQRAFRFGDMVALAFRGDRYRLLYALQLGTDVWLIHAFQKKSKTGIKTPKQEIDLIAARLRRLKEILQ